MIPNSLFPIGKPPFIAGPWFVSPNGRVKRAIFAYGVSFPIAEIMASPGWPSVISDGNARLIVAAPDLLNAAIEALTVIRDPAAQPTVDKLQATIRKTLGVQP